MFSRIWETWRCAKCGARVSQPAHPHNPPKHCGTGMWWLEFFEDKPYSYDDEAVELNHE